jgi:hypothetical protein
MVTAGANPLLLLASSILRLLSNKEGHSIGLSEIAQWH